MAFRPFQCRDCFGYRKGSCIRDRKKVHPDSPACEHFVLKERYYETHIEGYEAEV